MEQRYYKNLMKNKFNIWISQQKEEKSVIFSFIFLLFLIMVLLVCKVEAEDKPALAPPLDSSKNEKASTAPSPVDYRNQRGKSFYDQGEYGKAIEEFEQSLSRDPNNNFAVEYLILASQAKVKQDIEERLRLKKTQATELKKEINEQRPIEYIISEGDTIDISVWEWPNLKTEAVVRPDGKISFPMIGDVHASGLTLTQLDEQITERLGEYIRSPEVLVVFKSSGGKKIIILGEVGGPGIYKITGRYTILEAIAAAGGFSDDAVLQNVIVIRGGPNNPKPISLNLSKTIKKGDLTQDIPLETEDIVYVPKTIISNVTDFISKFSAPINQSIYTKKTIRQWWTR